MEYKSKYNDKKNSLDMKIGFDDVTDVIQKTTIDNIKTELNRADILGEILELFIGMTLDDVHITMDETKYNKVTKETSVSFFFGKFMESVVLTWGQNVSLIEIKSYSFAQSWNIGNIAIVVKNDAPPMIENLLGDEGSNLSLILFKHLKRKLSQYKPKIK
jgi:hypothetical protein